ncbi:MAG: RES family NAD+ phosphorylase [Gammaproteobacteria bacterium]|nr:RES family NAD+ phosphorylase [Rhodospirillaceae bacterium]MDE0364053.1 RES family NAD+ phosphorylase [Gammaproteobacteria bacterium]
MTKLPKHPNLDRLEFTDPERCRIESGDELWRLYFRGGEHPSLWNQFRTVGPTDARFDHHPDGRTDTARAVMYLAMNPVTCLAEVFQKTRTIHRTHKKPALVGFAVTSPLNLLDLTGEFPTRIGASMALMTGSRSVGRNWARALHASYPEAQGFAYPSSMLANAVAIVLNERTDAAEALPRSPGFHKTLDDPGMITLLKNAARRLGYVIR